MIKVLQIGVIYLAMAIAFLHTAIPHKHHSELKASEDRMEHESSTGLIDVLALFFHNSEGDQNLENIQTSDFDHEVDNSSLIFLFHYFVSPIRETATISNNTYAFFSYEFFLIRPSGHRGPPTS